MVIDYFEKKIYVFFIFKVLVREFEGILKNENFVLLDFKKFWVERVWCNFEKLEYM